MRVPGTFEQEFNYELTIQGLMDSRMFVPTYADLLTYTDANYLILGFPVFVYDTDASLRGCYQCLNITALSNPNSWEKLGGKTVKTPLQITNGANLTITWSTDTPPGSGISYLATHGAFPEIVEENLGDDNIWRPNGAPAYSWNTDRSILSLFPQTQYTNFIII